MYKFKLGDKVKLVESAEGYPVQLHRQAFVVSLDRLDKDNPCSLSVVEAVFLHPADFELLGFPKTSLTVDELCEIATESDAMLTADMYRDIANAAIKRYVEDERK